MSHTERARAPSAAISMKAAATGTMVLLLGALVSNAIGLVYQLVIAHAISTPDVGRYYETTALIGIAVTLCTGGLSSAFVRYVAVLPPAEARGVLRGLGTAATVGATVVAAGFWFAAQPIAQDFFHDSGVAGAIRTMCISVPFAVVAILWAAVSRGKGAYLLSTLAGQVASPIVRLLVALLGIGLGLQLAGFAMAYVFGFAASAGVGLYAARRLRMGLRMRGQLKRGLLPTAATFALYRWGVDVLQVILLWIDTVILGTLFPPSITGIYSIATRVVVFSTVGLSALNQALAPLIAQDLHRSATDGLAKSYELGSRWMIILTFVPLAFIAILREDVLRVFGGRFEDGGAALVVLIAGYLVYGVCGPAGVVLNMSGQNRLILLDNALIVALNVCMNLVLDPRYGMIGAATAWALALALVNVLMVLQARWRLGIRAPGPLQLKTSLAFTIACATGGLGAIADPLIGVLAASGAFALAGWATRAPEEAEWIRWMVGRVRGRGTAP